ncbi:MAG: beta-galactosidase [Victivallales bacterium]|nr:beta-galactosidase [Victivallales bacterium]
MRRHLFLLLGMMAAQFCIGQISNEPCIPCIAPVKLDGVISPGEYASATRFELRTSDGKSPNAATQVWIGHDKTYLYTAFECLEPDVKKMKRVYHHSEERDLNIWQDDCVEIFLSPTGVARERTYHFIVNADGVIYDDYNGNISFNSSIKTASIVQQDRYVVETAIPMADINAAPVHGAELWRFNLGRERRAGQGEYTAVNQGEGGFAHHTRMRPIRLASESAAPGFRVAQVSGGFTGKLKMYNAQNDRKNRKVTGRLLDKNGADLKQFQLELGEKMPIDFDFSTRFPGGIATKLKLEVADANGKLEYSNAYSLLVPEYKTKTITRRVENPLFRELFSDAKPRKYPINGWLWDIGLPPFSSSPVMFSALQYGLRYDGDAILKEIGDCKWAVCYNSVLLKRLKENKKYWNRPGAPKILMVPRVLNTDLPDEQNFTIFVLPEVQKRYLEILQDLEQYRPRLAAIVLGDEISEHTELDLIRYAAKKPDNPDVKAIDRKIKERFGNGKYGIPNESERDPLALIAYRRFLNEELVSFYRKVYQTIKSKYPDVMVVSDDPIDGQNQIYAMSDWTGAFDIATRQLYPSQNPNIDSFGFCVKYMRDLTGAESFWPCPHIEEYGASFTPSEVLDELSAAIRCGANGLQYYLLDTRGRREGVKYLHSEYFGAPDRFQVERDVSRTLSEMPSLNFPRADCALFSSSASLQAYPVWALRGRPQRDLHLHGFLAFGAGVWYDFINELTLKNLASYKFVVSNENKYVDGNTVKELRGYVASGGTLLLLNHEAFMKTPEGDDNDISFLGIAARKQVSGIKDIKYGKHTLPLSGSTAYSLFPAKGAIVKATYSDGAPAVIENKVGKGKVITLGFCPCSVKLAGNRQWRDFFREFAATCGAVTGQPIWRFRLPENIIRQSPEPNGTCLTGNAGYWRKFVFHELPGGNVNGGYLLSPAPDAGDESGLIPFAKGRLTDRRRAVKGASVALEKSRLRDWADTWNKAKQVDIAVKFDKAVRLGAIKLFLRGKYARAKILAGKLEYAFPQQDTAAFAAEEVMKLPEPVTASEIVIRLENIEGRIDIGEMEIWE